MLMHVQYETILMAAKFTYTMTTTLPGFYVNQCHVKQSALAGKVAQTPVICLPLLSDFNTQLACWAKSRL